VRRADGKPDSTAHHVLLALATWAGKDGRARPSVPTLADATLLDDKTVSAALGRLAAAGLIQSEGRFGGTGCEVWALIMDRSRESAEDPVGRRERKRQGTRERMAKLRKNRAVTLSHGVTQISGDAVGERHVTPSDGVTNGDVTPWESVSDAVGERHVTPSDGVRDAVDCVTPAGRSPRTAIELPLEELPLNCHPLPTAAERARTAYTPDFEAFWIAYGRKGAKRTAAGEWARAIKRADPALIARAVGPYVAATPDPKFRKDAERWLKGDCWESAVVQARAAGDYQPYRNPTDANAYDEDL
jgi:hypothetical protein